jgi:hypothetical protein
MKLALLPPLAVIGLFGLCQSEPKTEQKIDYTRPLVLRVAKSVFPDADQARIIQALDRYGTKPGESERERVQIAIMKVTDESEDGVPLEYFVERAKQDYRDVVWWAEEDYEQYLAWLERHSKPWHR